MSEYGSGIVVPLVRVAEHLHGPEAKRIIDALAWQEMEPIDREPLIRAVMDGEPSPWAAIVARTADADIGCVVHESISTWCVTAFEFLLGLNHLKCPQRLSALYATLKHMRFGDEDKYTGEDWTYVNRLFREATLEVDRTLLKVDADWGYE